MKGWKTPRLRESGVGMEINSYASARLSLDALRRAYSGATSHSQGLAATAAAVLGSAAGGGFPQWNCNAPTSKRAREGSARAKWRTQASVAVSADGERWVMLNASPDARQQFLQNQCLWPRKGLRDSPVRAVVLTSAEIDHVAGLLSMRESQPFVLWGTRRVLGLLAENPIFGALNPEFVERRAFALGQPVDLAGSDGPLGLAMTAFAVPRCEE